MNMQRQTGMDWADWDGREPDGSDPFLLSQTRMNDDENHLVDNDGTVRLVLSGPKPEAVNGERTKMARRLAEQLLTRQGLPIL